VFSFELGLRVFLLVRNPARVVYGSAIARKKVARKYQVLIWPEGYWKRHINVLPVIR
jgi:hypothetical protein